MKLLFSAYRLDQYSDPDGFMAQAAIVLSGYDPEIVCYVTDPRTGIQRTQKFPPTISEITDACEARGAAKAREVELERWRERKRRTDELRAEGVRVPERKEGTFTYAEFLKYCEQNNLNPRPIGRFEKAPEGSA